MLVYSDSYSSSVLSCITFSGYGLRDPAMLLIVAARCGKTRIMDLLLTRGADIDATDADGRTAVYELLNYWVTHGSLPALKMLLSHGADVNLARKDRIGSILDGMSPLMCAASAGGPDLVRPLLRAGADPEQRDGGNCTVEERFRSDFVAFDLCPTIFIIEVPKESCLRVRGGQVEYDSRRAS